MVQSSAFVPKVIPRSHPDSILCQIAFFFASLLLVLSAVVANPFLLIVLCIMVIAGISAVRMQEATAAIFRTPIIWVFPAFALASTLWSREHTASLRAALELVFTVYAGSLAARQLSPRILLTVLFCNLTFIALLCVVAGHDVQDPYTGGVHYSGIFASANFFAAFIEILLLISVAFSLDRRSSILFRTISFMVALLSFALVVRSRSAGAAITSVCSVFLLIVNFVFAKARPALRVRLGFALFLIAIPASILIVSVATTLSNEVLAFFGKDSTLTGRTLLWGRAFELIPLHLWLGQGYSAFWVHDNEEAEALWALMHIDSRAGFHFHNTYIEATIELGILGAVIVALFFLYTLWLIMLRSWREGTAETSCLFAIAFLFVFRSMAEVELLSAFSFVGYVFAVIAAYGLDGALDTRKRIVGKKHGPA